MCLIDNSVCYKFYLCPRCSHIETTRESIYRHIKDNHPDLRKKLEEYWQSQDRRLCIKDKIQYFEESTSLS